MRRGLEIRRSTAHVSPGLTAGGGLKPSTAADAALASRFPRPHRRGRIETDCMPRRPVVPRVSPGLTAGGGLKPRDRVDGSTQALRFPRPHRRGRIETWRRPARSRGLAVSPGLTAGGGLKLADRPARHVAAGVSPGLTAGGGLKHRRSRRPDAASHAFPPASPPGAD